MTDAEAPPRLDFDVLSRTTTNDSRRTSAITSRMVGQSAENICETEVTPEGSVYSYFLFIPPIEQRRSADKRVLTPLSVYAFVLCAMNFAMQFGLLYVVGEVIMRTHSERIGSITYLKRSWFHILDTLSYEREPGVCRTPESPMCFEIDGFISCSPPSIQVLSNWRLLDTNNDGVWSRAEVLDRNHQKKMQCRHNLDIAELYDLLIMSLNTSHVLAERRDQKLIAGQGIEKAYLDWYLHKPLLCMYGHENMCGNVLKRGFFDAGLQMGSRGPFKDGKAALQYCQRVLRHECFQILPRTYQVWRLVSEQQCGETDLSQGLYQNPNRKERDLPILMVDFRKSKIYQSTQGFKFRLFLWILLSIFIIVMFLELKSILVALSWCIFFQSEPESRHVASDAVEVITSEIELGEGEEEREYSTYKIHKVRLDHKLLVVGVQILRGGMWVYLLQSGIMFLTGAPRYLNLIFDALSLVFIFQVDELLYTNMVDSQLSQEHMEIMPMTFHKPSYMQISHVWSGMAGLAAIALFAFSIVITYCNVELTPMYNSLRCLCSQEGPSCYEAEQYSKAFWDNYWSNTYPKADLMIGGRLQS